MPFWDEGYYEAEARSHEVIQEEFGEVWWHVPTVKTDVNKQALPDPTQPRYPLRGILDEDAQQVKVGLEQTKVSSNDADLTVLARELRLPVFRGHWFLRERTGRYYEVKDKQRDSASGVVFPLMFIGLPRCMEIGR